MFFCQAGDNGIDELFERFFNFTRFNAETNQPSHNQTMQPSTQLNDKPRSDYFRIFYRCFVTRHSGNVKKKINKADLPHCFVYRHMTEFIF